MDSEFKRWVYESGINIDATLYRITLPEPSDYHATRQQALDADMLNNFSSVDGIPYFAKRFILERYAGLTKDEIRLNEDMLRAEKGMTGPSTNVDLAVMYQPEDAEAGGFDGGMGGGGGAMGGDTPDGEDGGDMDDADDVDNTDGEESVGQADEQPAPDNG